METRPAAELSSFCNRAIDATVAFHACSFARLDTVPMQVNKAATAAALPYSWIAISAPTAARDNIPSKNCSFSDLCPESGNISEFALSDTSSVNHVQPDLPTLIKRGTLHRMAAITMAITLPKLHTAHREAISVSSHNFIFLPLTLKSMHA
jgi:hypothetical protein